MGAVPASGVILVVDDDDDLRNTLVDSLQGEGYHVLSAGSGESALELLRGGAHHPCLLLLDLWMPGMDGWQLRHALKEDAHLNRLPIVVMTAARDQSASFLDVAEILEKPFGLDRLLHVVRRHCGVADPPAA